MIWFCSTHDSRVGYLGSIHCHGEAPGPIHLLSKSGIGSYLCDDIQQGTPGAELSDDADWIEAQAHESDDVRMPQSCHDCDLQQKAL